MESASELMYSHGPKHAAKKTLEKYGDLCNVRIVNNPVAEEDPDNRRFLKDVERWLGVEIEIATNPLWPNCSAEEVWKAKRYISGTGGAPCTRELKKFARQSWEALNLFNFSHANYLVLGFTADEEKRHDRFVLTERTNLLPILIDEGLTKSDCWSILRESGIKLPRPYLKEMPNANCIGCGKATSPTYWNVVRREYPEVFRRRAELSRELGVRLVEYKGDRIFLDELPPDAVGGKLRTIDFECGIFCEEKMPV